MNKPKGYPHKQPFNIQGNRTDKRGWWSKPPYHNNGGKRESNSAKSHD